MAAIRFSLIVVALIGLPACGEEAEPPPVPAHAIASACEARRFEGSAFTACRYDRRRHEIALFLDGRDGQRLRSLSALERDLGPRAGRLRFAMNAGMYDEGGGPIGLYVADRRQRRSINRRRGPGNFHMLPNGVFQVMADGRVSVVRSRAYDPARPPRWATQSGPMLVIDGALHPAIRPNGESLNIRNGVGVANPDTAWFVISEEPVSFGRLARFFRDRLGCRNALFLDGSVSSLWDRPAGRQDGYDQLGPLVAVLDRAPRR